ncbi:MAG: hypothetical protein VE98_C0001G0281 [candidate division Kazan bacterium GW2011_GWA1_50_15]|uniref:Uncharacterized protein n=2 Tax=Bacteria division Kazan-3B-28 TaxID=1798534 RepID=A0A0G2A3J6_UNCK3|nr:MAG: hypothetical protein VE98_C0001G0281 [candidate division Kazan bacterium GW2011_GWA1_50_15]KKW25443.1 MAG: hypothetical protein VE99_C0001G0080 [candidate division Kazan bacterium GW2011_GWC1_52_13]KKW26749.1 MAG: hypothetical protein VF00_C0002G0074 [candidate division Kazan bacterium GW2011_GWB1_52_7]HAV65745.1 hypothetical protein [Patescibacteria group bacterium]HCR42679.1 hypothetical protein [Patescibacteria group bacterium]
MTDVFVSGFGYTGTMPVTSYLVGVAVTTILAAGAWGMVLVYFDPGTAGPIGLVLFLVSLGVAAIGLLTMLFYGLYFYVADRTDRFWIALREGTLLGLVGIGGLILQVYHMLSWWNIGLAALAAVVLEVYFRVKVE